MAKKAETIDETLLEDVALDEGTESMLDERLEALQAGFANHCPFSCADHDLDEYGYCPHLIGFTNDGKRYEAISPLLRGEDAEGKPIDTGYKTVKCGKRGAERKLVQKSDKLVNPEFQQMDENGMMHTAKKWVSARVYRKVPLDS